MMEYVDDGILIPKGIIATREANNLTLIFATHIPV